MSKRFLRLSWPGVGFLLASAFAVVGQPVLPVAPAASPTPADKAPAPKIQFVSLVHEFGKVSAGEVVRADFTFTNVGTAPLEITQVRPTCGCTTAGSWERRIEPGKTGTIPLQVNTANFAGPVVKYVTVVCNDPSQPNVMLQIKGTIWKPIDVTPTFVVFNVVGDAQTNDSRTVKIVNNTDGPLAISDIHSSNPSFRAELKTNQPGKEYEVQITTVPPLASGTVQGQVTARTSSTNMPALSITTMAMVQPPVSAMPGQVFLQPGPLPSQTLINVSVRNNSAQFVTLSSPSVSVSNVQAQILESQPGKLFDVRLTFPAGFVLPAGQKAELTVKTSHPKYPLLTVPIVQIPGSPAPSGFHAQRPAIVAPPPPPPSIAAPALPPRSSLGAPPMPPGALPRE